MTISIFATRLLSARKAKGMSLQKLADVLGGEYNKQLLNRFEKGIQKPNSTQLIDISKILNINSDYFSKPVRFELGEVYFRKTLKLNKTNQERIKEVATDYLERYIELEEALGIPSSLKFTPQSVSVNFDSIETVAEKLRKEIWQIGFEPLASIVNILEEHGIKVFAIDNLDGEPLPDSFSGFSKIVKENIGFIVFNNHSTIPLVRRRFTLLHEFAHLYLKLKGLEHKQAERLCNAFAGAVLIPKQTLIETFGSFRTNFLTNELLLFKKKFGASLSAIMYRNKEVGIVSESYLKYFMIEYNQKWRNLERNGYEGQESSDRFLQLLLRALAQDVISESKAASLNNMKVAEFHTFLERMFDENSHN